PYAGTLAGVLDGTQSEMGFSATTIRGWTVSVGARQGEKVIVKIGEGYTLVDAPDYGKPVAVTTADGKTVLGHLVREAGHDIFVPNVFLPVEAGETAAVQTVLADGRTVEVEEKANEVVVKVGTKTKHLAPDYAGFIADETGKLIGKIERQLSEDETTARSVFVAIPDVAQPANITEVALADGRVIQARMIDSANALVTVIAKDSAGATISTTTILKIGQKIPDPANAAMELGTVKNWEGLAGHLFIEVTPEVASGVQMLNLKDSLGGNSGTVITWGPVVGGKIKVAIGPEDPKDGEKRARYFDLPVDGEAVFIRAQNEDTEPPVAILVKTGENQYGVMELADVPEALKVQEKAVVTPGAGETTYAFNGMTLVFARSNTAALSQFTLKDADGKVIAEMKTGMPVDAMMAAFSEMTKVVAGATLALNAIERETLLDQISEVFLGNLQTLSVSAALQTIGAATAPVLMRISQDRLSDDDIRQISEAQKGVLLFAVNGQYVIYSEGTGGAVRASDAVTNFIDSEMVEVTAYNRGDTSNLELISVYKDRLLSRIEQGVGGKPFEIMFRETDAILLMGGAQAGEVIALKISLSEARDLLNNTKENPFDANLFAFLTVLSTEERLERVVFTTDSAYADTLLTEAQRMLVSKMKSGDEDASRQAFEDLRKSGVSGISGLTAVTDAAEFLRFAGLAQTLARSGLAVGGLSLTGSIILTAGNIAEISEALEWLSGNGVDVSRLIVQGLIDFDDAAPLTGSAAARTVNAIANLIQKASERGMNLSSLDLAGSIELAGGSLVQLGVTDAEFANAAEVNVTFDSKATAGQTVHTLKFETQMEKIGDQEVTATLNWSAQGVSFETTAGVSISAGANSNIVLYADRAEITDRAAGVKTVATATGIAVTDTKTNVTVEGAKDIRINTVNGYLEAELRKDQNLTVDGRLIEVTPDMSAEDAAKISPNAVLARVLVIGHVAQVIANESPVLLAMKDASGNDQVLKVPANTRTFMGTNGNVLGMITKSADPEVLAENYLKITAYIETLGGSDEKTRLIGELVSAFSWALAGRKVASVDALKQAVVEKIPGQVFVMDLTPDGNLPTNFLEEFKSNLDFEVLLLTVGNQVVFITSGETNQVVAGEKMSKMIVARSKSEAREIRVIGFNLFETKLADILTGDGRIPAEKKTPIKLDLELFLDGGFDFSLWTSGGKTYIGRKTAGNDVEFFEVTDEQALKLIEDSARLSPEALQTVVDLIILGILADRDNEVVIRNDLAVRINDLLGPQAAYLVTNIFAVDSPFKPANPKAFSQFLMSMASAVYARDAVNRNAVPALTWDEQNLLARLQILDAYASAAPNVAPDKQAAFVSQAAVLLDQIQKDFGGKNMPAIFKGVQEKISASPELSKKLESVLGRMSRFLQGLSSQIGKILDLLNRGDHDLAMQFFVAFFFTGDIEQILRILELISDAALAVENIGSVRVNARQQIEVSFEMSLGTGRAQAEARRNALRGALDAIPNARDVILRFRELTGKDLRVSITKDKALEGDFEGVLRFSDRDFETEATLRSALEREMARLSGLVGLEAAKAEAAVTAGRTEKRIATQEDASRVAEELLSSLPELPRDFTRQFTSRLAQFEGADAVSYRGAFRKTAALGAMLAPGSAVTPQVIRNFAVQCLAGLQAVLADGNFDGNAALRQYAEAELKIIEEAMRVAGGTASDLALKNLMALFDVSNPSSRENLRKIIDVMAEFEASGHSELAFQFLKDAAYGFIDLSRIGFSAAEIQDWTVSVGARQGEKVAVSISKEGEEGYVLVDADAPDYGKPVTVMTPDGKTALGHLEREALDYSVDSILTVKRGLVTLDYAGSRNVGEQAEMGTRAQTAVQKALASARQRLEQLGIKVSGVEAGLLRIVVMRGGESLRSEAEDVVYVTPDELLRAGQSLEQWQASDAFRAITSRMVQKFQQQLSGINPSVQDAALAQEENWGELEEASGNSDLIDRIGNLIATPMDPEKKVKQFRDFLSEHSGLLLDQQEILARNFEEALNNGTLEEMRESFEGDQTEFVRIMLESRARSVRMEIAQAGAEGPGRGGIGIAEAVKTAVNSFFSHSIVNTEKINDTTIRVTSKHGHVIYVQRAQDGKTMRILQDPDDPDGGVEIAGGITGLNIHKNGSVSFSSSNGMSGKIRYRDKKVQKIELFRQGKSKLGPLSRFFAKPVMVIEAEETKEGPGMKIARADRGSLQAITRLEGTGEGIFIDMRLKPDELTVTKVATKLAEAIVIQYGPVPQLDAMGNFPAGLLHSYVLPVNRNVRSIHDGYETDQAPRVYIVGAVPFDLEHIDATSLQFVVMLEGEAREVDGQMMRVAHITDLRGYDRPADGSTPNIEFYVPDGVSLSQITDSLRKMGPGKEARKNIQIQLMHEGQTYTYTIDFLAAEPQVTGPQIETPGLSQEDLADLTKAAQAAGQLYEDLQSLEKDILDWRAWIDKPAELQQKIDELNGKLAEYRTMMGQDYDSDLPGMVSTLQKMAQALTEIAALNDRIERGKTRGIVSEALSDLLRAELSRVQEAVRAMDREFRQNIGSVRNRALRDDLAALHNTVFDRLIDAGLATNEILQISTDATRGMGADTGILPGILARIRTFRNSFEARTPDENLLDEIDGQLAELRRVREQYRAEVSRRGSLLARANAGTAANLPALIRQQEAVTRMLQKAEEALREMESLRDRAIQKYRRQGAARLADQEARQAAGQRAMVEDAAELLFQREGKESEAPSAGSKDDATLAGLADILTADAALRRQFIDYVRRQVEKWERPYNRGAIQCMLEKIGIRTKEDGREDLLDEMHSVDSWEVIDQALNLRHELRAELLAYERAKATGATKEEAALKAKLEFLKKYLARLKADGEVEGAADWQAFSAEEEALIARLKEMAPSLSAVEYREMVSSAFEDCDTALKVAAGTQSVKGFEALQESDSELRGLFGELYTMADEDDAVKSAFIDDLSPERAQEAIKNDNALQDECKAIKTQTLRMTNRLFRRMFEIKFGGDMEQLKAFLMESLPDPDPSKGTPEEIARKTAQIRMQRNLVYAFFSSLLRNGDSQGGIFLFLNGDGTAKPSSELERVLNDYGNTSEWALPDKLDSRDNLGFSMDKDVFAFFRTYLKQDMEAVLRSIRASITKQIGEEASKMPGGDTPGNRARALAENKALSAMGFA
ncbi:MAG TPA: hypothetical protein PKL97_09105, partial [Candidatus Omnitrophota bacterium]|nr:hypothetical protein [Candidatus Omnitrophota bacterium]